MDAIRTLRTRAGWSQRELAERLGVDRTAIVKYENGDGEPSLRLAIRIADLFGVSMDELLGRKPPEKSAFTAQENPLLHAETQPAVERTQPIEKAVVPPPTPAQKPLPEDDDPALFLLLHELRHMNPALRQRVSDFVAGVRAAGSVLDANERKESPQKPI